MSVLRSLLFVLYQLVLTPVYAIMVLSLFWLRPIARFRFITGWCWLMLRLSRTPRVSNMKQAGKMLGLVILPTVFVFAVIAGFAHSWLSPLAPGKVGLQWFAGHLTGMSAMLMQPALRYDPWRFAASIARFTIPVN